jgi:GcrA cell cycle regulator
MGAAMRSSGFAWTDERIATLKKLWAEGLSASQIAARLGDITRNAVIGKVHRLGLSQGCKPRNTRSSPPRPRVNVPRRTSSKFGADFPPAPDGPGHNNTGSPPSPVSPGAPPSPPPPEIAAAAPPPSSRNGWSGLAGVVDEFKSRQCRWPIGGPYDPVTTFCGAPTIPGTKGKHRYCEHHEHVSHHGSGKTVPSGRKRNTPRPWEKVVEW